MHVILVVINMEKKEGFYSIVSKTKEKMEECAERISLIEKSNLSEFEKYIEIDNEFENFGRYWKDAYNKVLYQFGEKRAREFQKEMLAHHNKNIRRSEKYGDTAALFLDYLFGLKELYIFAQLNDQNYPSRKGDKKIQKTIFPWESLEKYSAGSPISFNEYYEIITMRERFPEFYKTNISPKELKWDKPHR